MTERLYDLKTQLIQIDSVLAANTNPETEEILSTAREALLKAIDGKLENICDFISDCTAKVAQLKEREEVFYSRRKSLEKKIEYLKGLVFSEMKNRGEAKQTYGDWNCSIAKTPAHVIIDVEDLLPQDCIKTVRAVDKTAIKGILTDGQYKVVVDGQEVVVAHTEQGECLKIK